MKSFLLSYEAAYEEQLGSGIAQVSAESEDEAIELFTSEMEEAGYTAIEILGVDQETTQ